MFIRFVFLLVLLALAVPARAQAPADSAVHLPDVTVVATRQATSVSVVPSRVTVLASARAAALAPTVADLLGSSSGAFLRRYGDGGLASISLRGTGASQSLVLLDGHRIADPQLGQLDLSLLPSLLFESVEVMHGAGSALYGTDALGGVVNLRTARPQDGPLLRLTGGFGAYGERAGAALVGGGSSTLAGQVAVDYEAADGDFPYLNTALWPPHEVRRAGADRRRTSVFATGSAAHGLHNLRAGAWYANAERGLPGPATTTLQGERQWDESLRLWADDALRLPHGTLRIGGLVQHGALRYRNPAQGVDDTGRTLIGSAEAELSLAASSAWALGTGLTAGFGRATHPALADDAHDRSFGAFAHASGRLGPLMLYPSARVDHFVAQGARARTPFSPRLGLNLQVHPAVHLKASAGRAFRMPTFNDRFWQPGGNPDLRPEQSWTADAGLTWRYRRLQAEGTVYTTRTHDQIVWQPTGTSGFYAPLNLSRVHTRGVEASVSAVAGRQPDRTASATLFYTYTDARDRSDPASGSYDQPLRYIPRESLKLNLALRHRTLEAAATLAYVGRRYTTSDATAYLDWYSVADVQAGIVARLLRFDARLSLVVENVFDARYAVVEQYPMPPRHARLRLLLEAPGRRRS